MSAQDTQDGNIEISENGDGMLAIHFAWLWEHTVPSLLKTLWIFPDVPH